MSESTAAGVAGGTAERDTPPLTPEAIEAILGDFRQWLAEAARAGATPPPPDQPIDLHTLLGQMTALKHEVNLQTKSSRAQQEQNAETLRILTQSLQQKADSRAADKPGEDEALRPLLKTLIDAADVLGLARREVGRVQETLARILQQLEEATPAPPVQPRSFWARLFGAGPGGTGNGDLDGARQAAAEVEQFVSSVVTGYTMSLQRIERALTQHGLEPIPCEGAMFDPEQMEVVEAVAVSGRSLGEVLEEVRRGYQLRGRVFRFAQVRVAKG